MTYNVFGGTLNPAQSIQFSVNTSMLMIKTAYEDCNFFQTYVEKIEIFVHNYSFRILFKNMESLNSYFHSL